MQTKFLLPNRLKYIGWVIAIPAIVLMILNLQYGFTFHFLDYAKKGVRNISFDNGFLFNIQYNNFTDEIGSLLLLTGLLLIAFSKEKDEDERISKLRLESLLWAVFINSIFIAISIIFFYSELFLKIMAYNICSTLILFIIRFNLTIYFERKKTNRDNI
jgi:bacteriorhodopsin